jgi:hypothetical protein
MASGSAFAAFVIKDQTFDDAPEIKDCPHELQHIWDWFVELDATRTSGMTYNAITHQEITAFADGERINMLPFERRAIRAIDRAFIKFQNAKSKEKT